MMILKTPHTRDTILSDSLFSLPIPAWFYNLVVGASTVGASTAAQ